MVAGKPAIATIMRLLELFDSGASVKMKMQHVVMDMLTPLIAMKAPFVTIDQVIEQLHAANTGVAIDRTTVMDLLDPSKVQAVKSIDGDKIYLQPPEAPENAEGEDEEERNAEKIADNGKKQAQKIAKNDATPTPAPPPPPPVSNVPTKTS